MISKVTFAALMVGLLAGCGSSSPRQTSSTVKAVNVNGKATRCISATEMGLYLPGNELPVNFRKKLLTPEAFAAGVRIYREDNSVTTYGAQTLYYTNAAADCLLWTESLQLQEFSQRLGLSPLGLSPYYEADKGKTPEAKPVG